MNLASRDIRHNIGRFSLTTVGVGVLLMIVMGMAGIYRGLVYEATLLVDSVGADLWIVQRATRGPFAEISRVPRSLADRVAAVPGVTNARAFVYHTLQRERGGKPLRMAVLGLDWPVDRGEWLPLIAGRSLAQNHFEMIADRSLGLRLGEALRLGKDTYRVVGLARGMTDTGGNGFAFFTEQDARAVQFDQPGESIRLERAARRGRTGQVDLGQTEPALIERAGGLDPKQANFERVSATGERGAMGAEAVWADPWVGSAGGSIVSHSSHTSLSALGGQSEPGPPYPGISDAFNTAWGTTGRRRPERTPVATGSTPTGGTRSAARSERSDTGRA